MFIIGDGRDNGVPDLRRRQAELRLDHRHEGSDTEPGEEAEKEGGPRHVKRTHLGRAEIEQLYACCFIHDE